MGVHLEWLSIRTTVLGKGLPWYRLLGAGFSLRKPGFSPSRRCGICGQQCHCHSFLTEPRSYNYSSAPQSSSVALCGHCSTRRQTFLPTFVFSLLNVCVVCLRWPVASFTLRPTSGTGNFRLCVSRAVHVAVAVAVAATLMHAFNWTQ